MTLHQLLLFSARLKTLQAAPGPKGERGGGGHMTLHQLLLFSARLKTLQAAPGPKGERGGVT